MDSGNVSRSMGPQDEVVEGLPVVNRNENMIPLRGAIDGAIEESRGDDDDMSSKTGESTSVPYAQPLLLMPATYVLTSLIR